MVKDEADVIGGMLTHLADEVDGIIVADNQSTDETRDILNALNLSSKLVVLDDPDPAYNQSAKMSHLARIAGNDCGADWIVPIDADEIWFDHTDRLSVVLERATDATVAQAALFNHFATALDDEGDPFDTIQWRQPDPAPLPKVAFRYHPDAIVHQGNHGVTLPESIPAHDATFEVRHFPYRSAEQMVRKARNGAAAYKATDLPETQGAHWRGYGEIIERYGPEALHDVFREHFWALSPVDKGWVHDPAPYCRWRRPS